MEIRSQVGQPHVLVIGIVDTRLVLDTDACTPTPHYTVYSYDCEERPYCHTTVVSRLCDGGASTKRKRRPIFDGTNLGRGLRSGVSAFVPEARQIAVCDEAGCRCHIEHGLVIIDELAHTRAYAR